MGFINSPWIKDFIIGHTIKKVTEHMDGISIHFENGEHLRIDATMETVKCGCDKYCKHKEKRPFVLATPYKAKGQGVKGVLEIEKDKLIRKYIRYKSRCHICSNLRNVDCAFCRMRYEKAFRR
jgi:hypothetical protein